MNFAKTRLIVVAICMVAISFGFNGYFETPDTLANSSGKQVQAASCGKCGDGRCVRQCGENPISCPADCGVSSSD